MIAVAIVIIGFVFGVIKYLMNLKDEPTDKPIIRSMEDLNSQGIMSDIVVVPSGQLSGDPNGTITVIKEDPVKLGDPNLAYDPYFDNTGGIKVAVQLNEDPTLSQNKVEDPTHYNDGSLINKEILENYKNNLS